MLLLQSDREFKVTKVADNEKSFEYFDRLFGP